MIPVSLVRNAVKQRFVLDKYTLTNVAERLSRVVSDVSELTAARIEGMIVAAKRHTATNYDNTVRGHCYDGFRHDVKESVNAELRSRLVRK